MTTSRILTGLVLCAAVATGCGEDAADDQAAKPVVVDMAARQAQLEQDPYDLRCEDLADKVASAGMTRRVQYALADDAKIPRLNRLRASQSIFFAITEVCKGKPGAVQARPPCDRRRAQRRVSRRPRIALITPAFPDRLGLHRHGGRAHRKGRGAAARAAVPRGRTGRCARPCSSRARRASGRRRCGRRRWDGREARALRAIAARPTEAETSFAHAGLGDLVGAHPEALEDLPGPQRRALEAALLVTDGGDALDQQAVALATLAALRALARASPARRRGRRRPVARPAHRGRARLRGAAPGRRSHRAAARAAHGGRGAGSAGPRPAAGRRAPGPPFAGSAQPRRGPAPPAAPARMGSVTSAAPSRARAVRREPVLRARAGPRARGRIAAPGTRRAAAGDARHAGHRSDGRPLARRSPRASPWPPRCPSRRSRS